MPQRSDPSIDVVFTLLGGVYGVQTAFQVIELLARGILQVYSWSPSAFHANYKEDYAQIPLSVYWCIMCFIVCLTSSRVTTNNPSP